MWHNQGQKRKHSQILKETQFHTHYEPRPDSYQPNRRNALLPHPRNQPLAWHDEYWSQSYNYNNSYQSYSYYDTNYYEGNYINHGDQFNAYPAPYRFQAYPNYNSKFRKVPKRVPPKKKAQNFSKFTSQMRNILKDSETSPPQKKSRVGSTPLNKAPHTLSSQFADPVHSDFQKDISVPGSVSKIQKKLVVVGDQGSGKTSLLVAISKNKFCLEHDPNQFTGHVDMEVDGKVLQLDLWETNYHQNFNRLREVSYFGANVIIICFRIDCTGSLENIFKKWIPEVKYNCPNVPIVLVGNKMDIREDMATINNLDSSKTFVTLDQGLDMAKKVNAYTYLECSAKNTKRVREVFEICTRLALLGENICRNAVSGVNVSKESISTVPNIVNKDVISFLPQTQSMIVSCSQKGSLADADSQNNSSSRNKSSCNLKHAAASTLQNKTLVSSTSQNISPATASANKIDNLASKSQNRRSSRLAAQLNKDTACPMAGSISSVATLPSNKNPATHFPRNKCPVAASASTRNKIPSAALPKNKSPANVTPQQKNPATTTSQNINLTTSTSQNNNTKAASCKKQGASRNHNPALSENQSCSSSAPENKDPPNSDSRNKGSKVPLNKNDTRAFNLKNTSQNKNLVLIDLDTTLPSYNITNAIVNTTTTKSLHILPAEEKNKDDNLMTQSKNKDNDLEEVTYLYSVDPNEGRLVELVDLSEESEVSKHASSNESISTNSYIAVKINSEASNNVTCDLSSDSKKNEKSSDATENKGPKVCGEACCLMCYKPLKELQNNKYDLYIAKCGHLFCILCIKKKNKCIKCKMAISNLRKIML